MSQNSQLKRLLSLNQQRIDQQPDGSGTGADSTSPQLKKKRTALLHTTHEGHTILDESGILQEEQTSTTSVSGTVSDINLQLMQEQRLRLRLEERVKSLECQLSMSSQHTPIHRPPSNLNPTSNVVPSQSIAVANPEPEQPQTITILTTSGKNESSIPPSADQLLSRSNPLPPNPTIARLPTTPQQPPTAILLQAAAVSAGAPATIPVRPKVNPPPPVPSQMTVTLPGQPNTQALRPQLAVAEKSMVAVPASVLQAAISASKKDNEIVVPSQSQQPSLQRVEMERLPTLQPSLPPPTLPSVPLPRQSPQSQQQSLSRGTATILKLETSGNELRDAKSAGAPATSLAVSGDRRFVLSQFIFTFSVNDGTSKYLNK